MQQPKWWSLLLLALVLWGGEILRRDLWEPDEARYAYVAREMREGGHWLVPHRNGEFYAHKPPLLFWLINAVSALTGLPIGRITARLPGWFSGVLALWATARLAERWRGAPAAWPSVLTLCTTYLAWHEIGFGRMEALLLGLTTTAFYLLIRNDDAPGLWRPALAYGLMGLAVLTKGPVGFIVPAGAYATVRLAAGEGGLLKKSHWLWGPWITLAFPAAWLGLAWWHGAPPGYFHELLYQQNVGRAAGELGHEQPWYYFLLSFPADFMPWTLFLPAAVLALWRESEARVFLRRVSGWLLFVLVFFTLLKSKRNLYIFGAFPAAALLIGGAWDSMSRAPGRWGKGGIAGCIGLFLVGGLGSLAAGFHPRLPILPAALWPAGLAALGGAGWLIAELRRRGLTLRTFFGLSVVLLLVECCVGLFVYPAVNPLKAPYAFANVAAEKIPSGRPVLMYRINGEILAWYAERPGRRFDMLADLEEAMRGEGRGLAVFLHNDWEEVRSKIAVAGMARYFRMGGKKMVWFEYDITAHPR